MHHEPDVLASRVARVRREVIGPAVRGPAVPLEIAMWSVPDAPDGSVGEPVDVATALAAPFASVSPGTPWGRPWGTAWFRLAGAVPPGWAGEAVDAVLDLGFGSLAPGFMAEGLVWRPDGSGEWVPWRGLHPRNHVLPVGEAVAGGEEVSWLVEAAANPLMWGLDSVVHSDRDTAGADPLYAVGACRLAVRHREVAALRRDLEVLVAVASEVGPDSVRRAEILLAVADALDALDHDDVVGTAPAARAALAEVASRPATASAMRLSAVGHAHIDTAWLWPERETVRKVTRTFTNALRTAEAHPGFVFACSQAAQYEWVRERYPATFAAIVDAVDRGQWAPVGGMWVEADGNLTGAESMARQFLEGQRYFREHFGTTCTEAWIPDVFGYPASFPQVFRLGGCERFLTQKMSWNRTNRFPHHTFWWEGIDGSRVFTHFPPSDTYSATVEPAELARAERRFAEKGRTGRAMLLFGHGDGGGGPAPDMLERLDRLADCEGMPTVEMSAPRDFFDAALAEYPDAPVWVGELYLEKHRGTYTSQARTKVGNRRCEQLLVEAELWSVAAWGTDPEAGFPAELLQRCWREVLRLQFHDVLPGSSIRWVHREAEAAHARIAAELEAVITEALDELGGGSPMVANPAPHARDEVVVVPDDAVRGDHVQPLADGGTACRLAAPAFGVAPLSPVPPDEPVEVGPRHLDNGRLLVTVGDDGCVQSLVHVATGREVIAAGGRGGLPQLLPDLPLEYDAWDIEAYDRHRGEDLSPVESIEVVDRGPLLGRIRVTRRFRGSSLVVDYVLRAGSPRLDVELDLDWAERDRLLKVAWPFDLLTDEVTRHIQFGHVRTAVHENTTWDAARFEVCAHHWVDAAEADFGVALLNDGRHGHDVLRTRSAGGAPSTTVRLSVAKGARYPDPRADLGRHRLRTAVLPHTTGEGHAPLVAEGLRLNVPLRVHDAGGAPAPLPGPLLDVDDPGVVVTAVKPAADGSGDLVVRLYESVGRRASPVVHLARPFGSARLTDFLEDGDPSDPPPSLEVVTGRTVRVGLRPHQIATVRFGR